MRKKKNVTKAMRDFSREKALFRKVGPRDPITGTWSRVLNRVVEPYQTQRDRSLRGKSRIRARRAVNARVNA